MLHVPHVPHVPHCHVPVLKFVLGWCLLIARFFKICSDLAHLCQVGSLNSRAMLGSTLGDGIGILNGVDPRGILSTVKHRSVLHCLICFYVYIPARTAQGGGGSFKDRKPIWEVGCCDAWMAELIHWWLERRPIYLCIYQPVKLAS